MQKTLELPEDLVRRLERRAAHDGRTPEQVAADLLAAGLPGDGGAASDSTEVVPKSLPLIKARAAVPADVKALTGQAWADWLKEIDQQDEVERYEKAFRREPRRRDRQGQKMPTLYQPRDGR